MRSDVLQVFLVGFLALPGAPLADEQWESVRLAGGVRALRRDLTYRDDLFGQLRPYSLGGAPVPALQGEWYPFAQRGGALARVGLQGAFEHAVLVHSTDTTGNEYPTTAFAWTAGIRGRHAFGRHEVGVVAGYGGQVFRLDRAAGTGVDSEVPGVDYRFLRFGPDGRIVLAPLSIRFRAAYLVVPSAGEVTEPGWFHRGSAQGIEGGVGLGVDLTNDLEACLDADVRRYFFDLQPQPGDPWIAGGATDQYLAATLSLAWHR